MINIEGVTKSFGELQILNGVNLNIEKGKIFGLVGRSGAGKSTLLRCINGLEDYDGGCLTVDGVDVKSLSKKDMRIFRKDIGMIFQHFSLLDRLSVYENIALPLKCWKYSDSYIDKKVKELLEVIDIPDKINARPKELSGGQKQRVAIARALTMDPKLLLCDEATSALDPKTAQSIISLLNRINQELGITMVVVTHQMSVLRRACQKIAILQDGNVAVTGDVEQVFLEQPPALRDLIGHKDINIPGGGINIEIFFTKDNSSNPIITRMARDLNIDFLIIGGEMENYRSSTLGSTIINIKNDDFKKVDRYLSIKDVIWKVFDTDKQLEKAGALC